VNPDYGSTFRSDATLKFMRGSRRQDPQAAGQEAPEAAEKAAPKQDEAKTAEKAAPKEEGNVVEQAVDAVTDAVADVVKDAQQGPESDSKKAQKAADKVADESKAKEKAAPEATNPLAAAGEAIGDAVDSVDETLAGAEKADPKKTDAKKLAADKNSTAGGKPENLAVASVPGCNNLPGWADKNGNDCEDYEEGHFCNRRGFYGDAWLDEWGKFEDMATNGKSALQVCCVCGGGVQVADGPAAAAPGGAPAPAVAAAPGPAGDILGSKVARPMQAQGFSGELIYHEDQKTMTDDWGREFGPHAGHRDIKTICMEHKDNEWCDLHGYYDTKKSAAFPVKSTMAIFTTMMLACLQ